MGAKLTLTDQSVDSGGSPSVVVLLLVLWTLCLLEFYSACTATVNEKPMERRMCKQKRWKESLYLHWF